MGHPATARLVAPVALTHRVDFRHGLNPTASVPFSKDYSYLCLVAARVFAPGPEIALPAAVLRNRVLH